MLLKSKFLYLLIKCKLALTGINVFQICICNSFKFLQYLGVLFIFIFFKYLVNIISKTF